MARFPSRLRPTGGGKKRRWRGRLAPSLLIIAVLAAGVTIGTSDRLDDAVAPPATFVLATPEPRNVEERRYLDAILPPTELLIGEGRLLSELGASRSRNILELRARAERFRTAADAVAAAEGDIEVPARLRPFSMSLNAGIADALGAIDAAERSVVRFDWDQVQVAVTSFTAAVEAVATALESVEQA